MPTEHSGQLQTCSYDTTAKQSENTAFEEEGFHKLEIGTPKIVGRYGPADENGDQALLLELVYDQDSVPSVVQDGSSTEGDINVEVHDQNPDYRSDMSDLLIEFGGDSFEFRSEPLPTSGEDDSTLSDAHDETGGKVSATTPSLDDPWILGETDIQFTPTMALVNGIGAEVGLSRNSGDEHFDEPVFDGTDPSVNPAFFDGDAIL